MFNKFLQSMAQCLAVTWRHKSADKKTLRSDTSEDESGTAVTDETDITLLILMC